MSLEGMINRYDALKYEKFMMDMQTGTIRRAVLSCVIEGAPTIEAEQVVHAEWTEGEQCSNCGKDAEFTEWTTERRTINGDGDFVNIEYEVKRTYHLTKRCPHCGARMDAKEE
ncbi:MAG: hypothetical protein IJ337_00585 [Clostridia bacterium]|nr:hypothetical protein [Clostridia bacterium]